MSVSSIALFPLEEEGGGSRTGVQQEKKKKKRRIRQTWQATEQNDTHFEGSRKRVSVW